MTLSKQFAAARAAGTPLMCIRTADPAVTIRSLTATLTKTPVVHWDIVRGIRAVNKAGESALADIGDGAQTISPVEALQSCNGLPEKTIAFFANFHRVVSEQGVSQALWNLRDSFKTNERSIVLLAPSIDLPVELQHDVVLFDEPLPSLAELSGVVRDTYKSAQLDAPDDATVSKATDAICGLSAFSAEQVCAMSIGKSGLDLSGMWERKRSVIEQTPGLSVWRGGETFQDIGGCANVKAFLTSMLNGNDAPRVIVFLDEVEKQFSGTGTDLSGVSTEMTGSILTWMQDTDANGSIFVGPPGAAKSACAKACGNTGGIPTISFDLGAMKGSLVGESNARLRTALKTVRAVGQGKTYWIATSNGIQALPPELKRRFGDAVFFFDLPQKSERQAIWGIYLAKYGLMKQAMPEDEQWTGAEIRKCASLAHRFKISLVEASAYIVPVARSDAEGLRRLREQASGTFISAGKPGTYEFRQAGQPAGGVSGPRKLNIGEVN